MHFSQERHQLAELIRQTIRRARVGGMSRAEVVETLAETESETMEYTHYPRAVEAARGIWESLIDEVYGGEA